MIDVTKLIFGKRALDKAHAEDYIDWAGEMLVQDYDSPSLRILAGLNRQNNTFEAQDYFSRCVKELRLNEPEPEAAVREYACEIAQQIIDEQITAQEGVRALYQVCLARDYPKEFMVWFELDDALDSLLAGDYPYTYESATLENFGDTVKLEAKRFIDKVVGQESA
jgi:hypothetical protein